LKRGKMGCMFERLGIGDLKSRGCARVDMWSAIVRLVEKAVERRKQPSSFSSRTAFLQRRAPTAKAIIRAHPFHSRPISTKGEFDLSFPLS
jgi:hypothetical protein